MTKKTHEYLDENELFRDETIKVWLIVSSWLTVPLYLLFWVCDLIFAPQLKWEFLGYRVLTVVLLLAISRFTKYIKTYASAQCWVILVGFITGLFISIMTYRTNGPYSSYYVGLMLVIVGGLGFVHWQNKFIPLFVGALYLPYLILCSIQIQDTAGWRQLVVNSFFLLSMGVVSAAVSRFNKNLRRAEFVGQLKLNHELASRNKIIHEKTTEAVRLAGLSTQFSPQVVEAIRKKEIDLSTGVHRSKICAIFIDIVGSTERVVRLDQDKIDKVLGQFMEDCVNTLLKYDITIDKFQGDGILGFANDPVKHEDFVSRSCMAAIEVRELIKTNREFYERHWKKELQICAGISAGFANVGFYGNQKFFKTYTAIGTPLPMAARLCSKADANQILVDSDIAEELERDGFIIKFVGNYKLKGFEQDINKVYELIAPPRETVMDVGSQTCPQCADSVLYLDTTQEGFFILKCRKCGFSPETSADIPKAA